MDGGTPGLMHRSKGHSAKPCCGHQVLAGEAGWGLSKSYFLGARPCSGPGPRSQVPFPETNTQRAAWNSTVSKQGCRQGALASHRLGAVEGTSFQAVVGSEAMRQPGGTLPAEWLHLISLVRQEGTE